VWHDGTVRNLAARGKVDYDEAGRPLQLTGVCWDVTQHHQAQENLRLAHEKLGQSVQELERRKEHGLETSLSAHPAGKSHFLFHER